jgi:predicted transglutaminase-like cysteine proteinase
MNHQTAQRDLNSRFSYQPDQGETWRILTGDGPVQGDCEDYALTLIWLIEGRSMFRFWWALVTFRYVLWHCRSPQGEGHAVLWMRGAGWTDNIQKRILPSRRDLKARGYRMSFPILFPLVALKFLLRPLLRGRKS